jgi:hypothetical protein
MAAGGGQGWRVVEREQVGQFGLDDDASAARLHRTGMALKDVHLGPDPAQSDPRA